MKNIVWCIVAIFFLQQCRNSQEFVSPQLLTNKWKMIEHKSINDNTWKILDSNASISVTLCPNGDIKYLDNSITFFSPFNGGWCNSAEKYTLKKNIVHFEYGKPNCIPFVNPQLPTSAKVIDLTKEVLIFEWNDKLFKFSRI